MSENEAHTARLSGIRVLAANIVDPPSYSHSQQADAGPYWTGHMRLVHSDSGDAEEHRGSGVG